MENKKYNNTNEFLEEVNRLSKTELRWKAYDNSTKNDVLKINEQSEYKPRIHITPLGGLLNDPNGLHEVDGTYYIYYQLSPFYPAHFAKHWGLYSTKDFINYKDDGVKISPVDTFDKQGIYSGAALVDEGKAHIYYTGNLRHESGLEENYSATTVYWDKETEEKKLLFEVDKTKYTRHFRDPVPYKKDGNKILLHAAQKRDISGTISVYESNSWTDNWKLKGDMIIDNLVDPGYMLECPTLVKIGDKELLGFLVQGSKQFPEAPTIDVAVATMGEYSVDENRFINEGIFPLDYGPDYYAPQIFNDSKGRTILIAWLGNNKTIEYLDANDNFNGALTIPRELIMDNGKLKQRLAKEIRELPRQELIELNNISNKLIEIKDSEIENENTITISNNNGHDFIIRYSKNELFVDRRNSTKMESETILMDGTKQPNWFKVDIENLNDMNIIIDHSTIEIFINDGEKTFTSRIYIEGNWNITSDRNISVTNIVV